MIQPIFSFETILIKRLFGSTYVLAIENFEQKAMQFNRYYLFGKF